MTEQQAQALRNRLVGTLGSENGQRVMNYWTYCAAQLDAFHEGNETASSIDTSTKLGLSRGAFRRWAKGMLRDG